MSKSLGGCRKVLHVTFDDEGNWRATSLITHTQLKFQHYNES